jgi:hypothetical protein
VAATLSVGLPSANRSTALTARMMAKNIVAEIAFVRIRDLILSKVAGVVSVVLPTG